MMKKRNVVSALAALCLVLSGCGASRTESTSSLATSQESVVSAISESVESQQSSDGTFRISANDSDMAYQEGTDDQPWYLWRRVAESGRGLYYEKNAFLYFFDLQTGTSVPVCNRPDCSHTDVNCNASLTGDIIGSVINYYDGNIYMCGLDDSYMCLYRFAADGSGRQKVMKLYRYAPEDGNGSGEAAMVWAPNFILHRGYVYYYWKEDETGSLYRQKIGSDTAETLYSPGGERPQVYRLEGVGHYVFFQAGNFLNDDGSELDISLMAYDTDTGKIETVLPDVYNSYMVTGTDLYYRKSGEIYHYSMEDGTGEALMQISDSAEFSADADRIYVGDSLAGSFLVYDTSGNYLGKAGAGYSVTLNMGHNGRVYSMGADGLMLLDATDPDHIVCTGV